ncbi:MAG: prenyltransferase/squalene oxidase repeat-containing protein, partial [Planctomycetaceae bacterium]
MPDEPYLLRLGTRLTGGLAKMDDARRERHRTFILSQQMPDGGFRGREGDSDLYYTGFAVRGLMILGGMTPDECERVSGYVRSSRQDRLSVIDLVSWLYSGLAVQLSGGEDPFRDAEPNWLDRIAETLESVRTADGGYAKTTEGAAGSTYHSFLVALTYELIGKPLPRPNRLIQFLYDRQRDDGGFVEIAPMKRSGTNPTAAAVALLTMFGGMDDEMKSDVRDFLKQVCSDEGGFQANTRIPFADGLSTFTGLLTAQDLDLDGLLKPARVERFLTEWLEFPTGGFRGASWDENADVEYTFYGLGILGLLGA